MSDKFNFNNNKGQVNISSGNSNIKATQNIFKNENKYNKNQDIVKNKSGSDNELKLIKIFLASSNELENDRREFEIYINRKNKELIKENKFIELNIWEDFLECMSQTRLQDEYNNAVKESDIFLMLFCTKVGMYTSEEFEIAFGSFKENNKPLIFTYFKDMNTSIASIDRKDMMSLWEFQDKLKNLGHFTSEYKDIYELKSKFDNQLEKLTKNKTL